MKTASVLLIDSYDDARQMYAEYLRTVDLRPIEVADTADALARAQEADIIVTAIRVRGPFDGIELIRRLRANGPTRRTPVIVLSAVATERSRALEAGCSTFLAKPCLPHVLADQITILLASAGRPQMARALRSFGEGRNPTMASPRQRWRWFSRLIRPAGRRPGAIPRGSAARR